MCSHMQLLACVFFSSNCVIVNCSVCMGLCAFIHGAQPDILLSRIFSCLNPVEYLWCVTITIESYLNMGHDYYFVKKRNSYEKIIEATH